MDNDVTTRRPRATAFKAVLCLAILLPVLAAVLLILPSLSLAQPAPAAGTPASDPALPQDAGALRAVPSASLTPPPPPPPPPPGGGMTISQTLSDEGQRNTIAFDGLAFLTGNLGADSFFPPGKVADFWGFQYLRDNDPSQMGHNTDFLTRAALNMLHVLTPSQRAGLIALAQSQVADINQYATNRFVLMKAFRRLLEDDLPAGATGLDLDAVKDYSAELYHLDGQISYARAQVMGGMLHALDATQRAYLDSMVGHGMLTWPVVGEPPELAGLSHDVKVAVMTYAGDMFSWYAGSVEADVYFCPERQGTYFGSFYMKDAPAVGNPGYSIPVTLTAEMGEAFLETLTPAQASTITELVNEQKPALYAIVDRREEVSTLLRQFMSGGTPSQADVLALMDRYGELDGEIIYRYATAFVQVSQLLTAAQRAELTTLRTDLLGDLAYPTGAYLYSQPIAMPTIPNTDFLFTDSAPLPVTLASFTASCQAGAPAIAWETVSEATTTGFNVWRSETDGAPEVRLNASVIPAHPGSTQGYRYTWTDSTAQAGMTYFYWLQDVDTGGGTHLNGPVQAACATLPVNRKVYLPSMAANR